MIEAIRCNMDIKFIGSGPSAQAVLYYITDYISKSQLKSHVTFAALELAVRKLDSHNDTDDSLTVEAKKLLQKCAYAMISHQELSVQQVCSYLMEYRDHYTSHEFKNLYWTAFEKFINDEDPSPECYNSQNLREQNMEQAGEMETNSEGVTDPEHLPDDAEHTNNIISDEPSDQEIPIKVNQAGELIACTSQIVDYQLCSPHLKDLNLWDAVAQVEKVRKNENQKQRHSEDHFELDCDENEHDDEMEDQGHINLSETQSVKELLSSCSRIQPKFNYLPDHPEHILRVQMPTKRFVPVPIGPSIPQCDHEAVREWYCRLMLIFFKPWRHAQDLRSENETWSDAFEIFLTNCLPETAKIIENMQLLHECKDSHDDHFAN